MCIARVGRVLALFDGKARVRFFDGSTLEDVHIAMVKAKKDSYIEVYANLALRVLTTKEAASRKRDWLLIRKAAGLTV